MNLESALTHIEWLIGVMGAAVVFAFGGLYWAWNDGRESLSSAKEEIKRDVSLALEKSERVIDRLERDFKDGDRKLDGDLDGVSRQMSAFQASMFSREDAGKLENKLYDRMDRVEDNLSRKIDEAVTRLRT